MTQPYAHLIQLFYNFLFYNVVTISKIRLKHHLFKIDSHREIIFKGETP